MVADRTPRGPARAIRTISESVYQKAEAICWLGARIHALPDLFWTLRWQQVDDEWERLLTELSRRSKASGSIGCGSREEFRAVPCSVEDCFGRWIYVVFAGTDLLTCPGLLRHQRCRHDAAHHHLWLIRRFESWARRSLGEMLLADRRATCLPPRVPIGPCACCTPTWPTFVRGCAPAWACSWPTRTPA